ncbi:restriction endonuclease subunit S domain-containing protein [Alienimonas californiensis]|uniref:Uncharacterized protein n=1 Tax=Alienimonas californiensis TaxID=2527989 RepID=A0A517P3L1_9PLAN|nr:hypothetical protein [Alienimonas californiensis]QDT13959.1 hypothetical protein CA12_00270 [Alienimonas californiensis]
MGLPNVSEPSIDPRAGEQRPFTEEERAEIVRRGNEIFERDVRPTLPPNPPNHFILIDVNGGGWEIDPDYVAASDRLYARFPNACGYARRLATRWVEQWR